MRHLPPIAVHIFVVVLICLSSMREAHAQPPSPAGVPQSGPTIEGGGSAERSPQNSEQGNEPADPRLYEKGKHSESADEAKQRTHEREESALQAQWEAAHAGRDQANLAAWQVWIGAFATIVAFLGTILLILTFRSTKRSVEIAAASARDARRAADAAENSVTAAIESSKAQLRAYVSLGDVKTIPITGDDGNIIYYKLSVGWKNYGQTPALNVVTSASQIVWHVDLLPPWFPFFDMPRLYGGEPGMPCVIAPNSENTVTFGFIPTDHIKLIGENKMYIFTWGGISYVDIFKVKHTVLYCLRSNGIYKDESGGFNISMTYYKSNNCIDDECIAQQVSRPPLPSDLRKLIMQYGDGEMGLMQWLVDQAPSTYERSPDGTPHDPLPRDQYGVRHPSAI